MSSSKIGRAISNLLILYFTIIFFYGVVIKATFQKDILFNLKTYIPEVLLAFVCLNCLIKRVKINVISFIMISVIALIMVLNVATSFSVASFMMTFRDVFVPLITGFFLCSVEISEKEKERFFSILVKLCMIALICGMGLGLFQYIMGWRWTSAWYTGYSFWGQDEASSLFIMTSGSHVRVPSIVGHNVKFAMYSFFQYLIISLYLNEKDKNKALIIKAIFSAVMLVNVFISNNKTTLAIIMILITVWLMKRFDKHSKIIFLASVIIIGGYFYFSVLSSSDFMLSFYDRFSKWSVLKDPQLLRNVFIPLSTYNFAGNSSTEISVLNYWDNTYLYFLFSFGMIGFSAVLKWINMIYRRINNGVTNLKEKKLAYYITIFTAIASGTTSIVLGRCFFSIYIIVIAYLASAKRGID